MRYVTTTERREMRRLRAEGKTLTDIAGTFGRSTHTVHTHTHDVMPPRVFKGPERRFDYAEAIRLHAEGVSFYRLAERYGVTASAVHKAVSKVRRQQIIPPESRDIMREAA